MVEIRSNNNVTYQCAYHVVWCPKYRRSVIKGSVDDRLKEIIREVCAEKSAPIIEMETMPDHVHLPVECDPQFGHQGSVLSAAPAGVSDPPFPSAYPLDQLLLRRHGRRRTLGGHQALCREPTQDLNFPLSSPWLKPGGSRGLHAERNHHASPDSCP